VDHLLSRLRRSRTQLALPPEAPSRARAAADFLRAWRPGEREAVLRAADLRPFVRETVDWVREAVFR
jgi:hypothetical protein